MNDTSQEIEIAIVGSGFSGLAMAARLKRSGRDDFVILERAREVGGTWRENTYPGCRCDVPSHVYSFSFAPEPGVELDLLRPARDPRLPAQGRRRRGPARARALRLRGRERALGRRRQGAGGCETSSGPLTARVLIAGAGPLHEPKLPDIPGLADFEGTLFHSATWDHDHDLAGERVAVIGTGASAIQFVPQIQPEVAQLHLFQRTAPWVMPRATSAHHPARARRLPALPGAAAAVRSAIYWAREAIAIPMLRVALAPLLRAVGEAHLRRQVRDPRAAGEAHPGLPARVQADPGRQRLPAVARPAERRGRHRRDRRGSRTTLDRDADGSEREVDTIILGTGFHVLDMPIADRIADGEGRSLAEHWDGSPQRAPGDDGRRLPQPVLPARARTPASATTRSSTWPRRRPTTCCRARPPARPRPRDARGHRRRPSERWNEAIQRRMKGTVWTRGRLLELVPGPQRAQHLAVAGLQLPLRPRAAALRPGRARRRAGGRRRARPRSSRDAVPARAALIARFGEPPRGRCMRRGPAASQERPSGLGAPRALARVRARCRDRRRRLGPGGRGDDAARPLARALEARAPRAAGALVLALAQPRDAGPGPGRLHATTRAPSCSCTRRLPLLHVRPARVRARPRSRLRDLAASTAACWSPARAASSGFLRIAVERREPAGRRGDRDARRPARGPQLLPLAARARGASRASAPGSTGRRSCASTCSSATASCARSRRLDLPPSRVGALAGEIVAGDEATPAAV